MGEQDFDVEEWRSMIGLAELIDEQKWCALMPLSHVAPQLDYCAPTSPEAMQSHHHCPCLFLKRKHT